MNKKGLTIVELLAVLTVIAMLAVIIFPIVTDDIKDSKSKAKNMQESSIKEAAESYVAENVGLTIFSDDITTEEVTLNTLIEEGYLTGDYIDPVEDKEYDLEASKVTITKNNNSYTYLVELHTK